MSRYIIKRLFSLVPVIIGVTFIVFIILSLSPGDPAQIMLGTEASPEALVELREELGLNDNVIVQYLRYMGNVIRGDLGMSYKTQAPVAIEVFSRFPNTIKLAILSIAFAALIAIPLGIVSAIKQNSIIDNVSMVVSLFGLSMPMFWLGLMLILLFSIKLGWLPSGGNRDGLFSLILPCITLGFVAMANIARTTRSSMLEVIRQDYIRTAKAKGVSKHDVIYKHALRNSLIPTVTIIGLQIGILMGGAVLAETVFAWPGIGRLMVESIKAKDTPTVLGCIIVFTVSLSIVNLIVDVLYAFIDPRIKAQYM